MALAAAWLACAPFAFASGDVRLWHSLDSAMASQLARLAAEYNAAQSEFNVRLAPLPAGAKGLVRLGLPLNTARPVLYYNRDAFRRAKLNSAALPKTWYDMAGVMGALADSGQACAYTTSWPAWVMLENTGGAFSRQLMVRWTSMLATWEKSGFFSYSGRANEAEARFAAGECAILTSSSASQSELAKRARFEVGVAPLPYYDDSGIAARGVPPTGAAVWAERQSVGVTNFFAFLATRAAEARRIRDLMEAELEAVWRGDKTALDALDAVSAKQK
ncbi:MAG TPA: extracellular solute-binding protein [Burkholderiales bacterium]|nr:extracellular solute-binding protein [Burkholderiales bacterium]